MSRHVKVLVPVEVKLALTVAEAAAMVGLSDQSVRRLVEDGRLARVPHTHRVLIARVELERFVTSNLHRPSVSHLAVVAG